MADTLRDRQKQLARTAILEATAAEVVEHGITNLSLQAVAARAGVSNRTLYNYFDNREALVAALSAWGDERTEATGGHLFPEGPESLPDFVHDNFLAWSQEGLLTQAIVQIGAVSAAQGQPFPSAATSSSRVAAIADDLGTARPDLDAAEREALAQVLLSLISSRNWHRLTVENDVPPPLAADAVAWALRTLWSALEAGDAPFAHGPGDEPGGVED